MDSRLPDELIIYILSLCDALTLITCRAVSWTLCGLIEKTTQLQYCIELYADGMKETDSPCTLSRAERLSMLRNRRAAWKDLRWTQRPTPMIRGSWSAYELVDGIFSKTLNDSRGVLFTVLPSKSTPGYLVKIDDVGFREPFRDFAIDPTQDLIVYMQCSQVQTTLNRMLVTLYFRTMSSNRPHGRALEPVISMELNSIDIVGAVIQIVNDVVGLMTWDRSCAQLYIWDWRQCNLLVSESRLHPLDDFVFISDRAYVLTSPHPDLCFRVYTLHHDTPPYALPRSPVLRATLHLPVMHEDASASQLGIHTGAHTTASQGWCVGPPRPFIQDSRRRVHIISLELWGPLAAMDTPTSCLLVVHNNTFLKFATSERDAYVAPIDLEWSQWGLDETRWLPGTTGSSWLRYVHGERLVRLVPSAKSGTHDLEVYDFGARRGPRSWYDQDKDNISTFESSVFTRPVIGRLPCRITRKEGNFPYSGFMIDEERLIGLQRDFDDQAGSVDVFAF